MSLDSKLLGRIWGTRWGTDGGRGILTPATVIGALIATAVRLRALGA